jgi:GAF domain-containing protein
LFGVGHFDGVRQAEEWNQMRQTEDYPDIESQLARLLSDSPLPGTPIDEWVRDRGFEIPEIGPIAAALKDLEPCIVREPVHLPREFQEAMELKGGVGVVPLTVGTEVIGLVAVDNKWTGQQISVVDLRALKMLADFAAVAIQQRAMKRRLEVISSLSLSSENPQDPRETLRLIAAATLEATSADAVALMLINELGQPEDPILSGTITDLEPALKTLLLPSSTEVRQRGVTQAFMVSEKVSADVDKSFRLSGIKSALCLPFLHPNPAGVMWIFSREKRKFDPALRKILELYANHAWAVFDKARRVAHLNQLNKAVSEMSSAPDVQNVTTAIVRKARELFGAQSSTFWPFEDQEFLYHARVSDGVTLNDLDPPSEGGASWQILKRGYLCRDDIAKPDDEGYRASYDFLARQGLRSFQGVALKVADTSLGVLFVSYNSPRRFRVRDKDELEEFATCAALALQNAKFFELKRAGRRAAEIIVQCNVLKAPEESFKLIAEAIKAALNAEVVLLYTYDQERDFFRQCRKNLPLGPGTVKCAHSPEIDIPKPPAKLLGQVFGK